ncbi:NAD(P)/FAD-dependent oxidoreductase [Pseudotabrizicola alkalilacus]|uniref:FAD-dependent oxidoreductase n=1 Tax=Pseudotabrizicola alkalilacus TaxID=2305252 RepID=A0A411Z5D7_9RHOB|nr:FAD-dependent oxidoreductase [Pseudotabrizicola alkalilacus]RGP38257.1 FAD-dependent oxidoreductase [Pseudotabrizicola alkalilacus]
MTRPDLTIRGGGIFGLSIAWEAARRGARVRLIETARIGAGSSGGVVGALAPHVPENWNEKKAFQLDSLLMAEPFWAGVTEASGLPTGYARLGRLQPLDSAEAVARANDRASEAQSLWQGRAAWQVVPATGAGWEPATPTGLLIHDTLSARLHPRLAAAALVAAVRAKGGEVVIGEAEATGPVIWATGLAGLLALNADLGGRVGAGVKGQALLLAHDARDLPQMQVDGLHIVPHADGTVAIGSTSENQWEDPVSVDAQCDALLARAVAAVPALQAAPVLERWAGIRPRARSRAPMLGAWPGRAGEYVANGGFKIGFGMAPKVAQVMVDLVLDGVDRVPEGFRVGASL